MRLASRWQLVYHRYIEVAVGCHAQLFAEYVVFPSDPQHEYNYIAGSNGGVQVETI